MTKGDRDWQSIFLGNNDCERIALVANFVHLGAQAIEHSDRHNAVSAALPRGSGRLRDLTFSALGRSTQLLRAGQSRAMHSLELQLQDGHREGRSASSSSTSGVSTLARSIQAYLRRITPPSSEGFVSNPLNFPIMRS